MYQAVRFPEEIAPEDWHSPFDSLCKADWNVGTETRNLNA
jgi:hypothetical protein